MNLSKNTKRRIVTALAEKKSAEELIAAVEAGSGGGGTINGAINLGAGGVGVFDSVGGSNLQFKNINAGSAKITVSDDSGNKEIDIDVSENEINVRNLKNVSPGVNASFAGWSDTGVLSSVPGYQFDDLGTLRVGAQNTLTVPAGVTDYVSIGISPTITNPGLVNLAGVQLNSPIDSIVANYQPFVAFGYGTSAPANYTAFFSGANYSGTGTNATYFSAGGGWNVTGTITGFNFNSLGNSVNLTGVNIAPQGNTTNFKGIAVTPNGNSTNFIGVTLNPTGTHTDMTGMVINLSGATSTNRKLGLSVEDGTVNAFANITTVPSYPALVDSGNIIRPVFKVDAGTPITGTDMIMSNLSGFMDIRDDMGTSPLGLGAVSSGLVSQVAVQSGKTLSKATMCLGALAIEATSTGGTILDAQIFGALASNFGGSLTIDRLYGFRMEDGSSPNASKTWGISIEDTGAENYLAKSLKIGGSQTVVSDPTIALEVAGPKSFRLPVLTTAQRLALPNIIGTAVYDSTAGKAYLNDGTSWNQFG